MISQQIKEICDCGKRVVNFMRDDAGYTPHCGQFLILAQCFLCESLGSDVPVYLENSTTFKVHGLATCNDDFRSVSRLLEKVSMPALSIPQGSFGCFSRDGEDCSQKSVDIFSDNFISAPSIESFRARIPKLNSPAQVSDHNGFSREVQQFRACAKLFFTLF